MNEEDHQRSVIEQYAPGGGMQFYRCVMGDGQPVIHYGIYRNDDDEMTTATKAATMELLRLALLHGQNKMPRRILELGSGPGGSAHLLARVTGANVTCVDLCPHHSRENERVAKELGIADQIETWTGSFEHLPQDWSQSFDLVWSQEAFCHAYKRVKAFREAARCLKKGGALALSDIMLPEEMSTEQAATYSQVNAISRWSNLSETLHDLQVVGFETADHCDWSGYLPQNFRKMIEQIKIHRAAMVAEGVSPELLTSFESSLNERLQWQPGEVLGWQAVVAGK